MCRIVIADDEYLEREVFKDVLRNLSGVLVVGETNCGNTAVELCEKLKPDIVFLNLKMGGVGGIEAAKLIRRQSDFITIVITTAYNDDTLDMSFMEIGVNECLYKPIRPILIENTVAKFMARFNGKEVKHVERNNQILLKQYRKHSLSKEISHALKYVDENFKEEISLELISEQVFLSIPYLSRLFKKEVGVNFSDYILHKRMDEAKKMLQSTNRPIIDISLELNFKEQNYFCRVFKKAVGMTPKEYRTFSKQQLEERKQIVSEYLTK